MEHLTCVLLGDALLIKAQFYGEDTTEEACERLIEDNAMVFEGLRGPRDLRLYRVTPWDPSDDAERRRFLNGEYSQQMQPIAVDGETPATNLLPLNASERSRVCVLVEIDILRTVEDSKIMLLGECFPARTLHSLKIPGLKDPQAFFHISDLPFGVKIDKPDHVLVRACFPIVFSELVPCIRQAFEDESTMSSRVLVVTGSPGIGKRFFLFYCVFCLLFDAQTIAYLPPKIRLVVTARYKTYLWAQAPGIFRRVDDADQLQQLASDSSVLRLVLGDGVDAAVSLKPSPPPIETWLGVTIFVATPNSDYRLPLAQLTPPPRKTWILPAWTLHEMCVVNETTHESRRLPTAELLVGFRIFGGNIQRVLNLSDARRKIHADYDQWNEWPLDKLLAFVKREGAATARDDSGIHFHMVPDARAKAGFRLQCACKGLGMVMVARNECNADAVHAITAFVMDPRADVRCDAVKRVLFEMLTCRWLMCHVKLSARVTMVFERLCGSRSGRECAPLSLRFGSDVVDSVTQGSLWELIEEFRPGRWHERLAYVGIDLPFAECPTVDAIVLDHKRWFLLSFCTDISEFNTQRHAVVSEAKAVARVMPPSVNAQVVPALVVPPWLREIVFRNEKEECQSTPCVCCYITTFDGKGNEASG